MKRLPVYAVLLVLLAAVVYLGGQSFSSGEGGDDPASISRYEADFRVDEDGDLHATETLTVQFPRLFSDRHGIFRFFDHRDPNADYLRRKPHDISVTRNGRPEPFELLSEGDGRYTNVKIGSAHETVEDAQVYVIRYVVDDVLLPVDGGERSRLYWDLIPAGWQMDIAEARLSVSLPADAEKVECHRGAGEVGGCTAQGEGTSRLTVETGALDAHTPVTVETELPLATPKRAALSLWPTYLDGILGQSLLPLLLALLLGGLAAIAGYKVSHSTREKKPAFPLLYAPPEGIGPAQAAYVLHEKLDNRAFVGSLMHAAELGAIDFTPQGNAWTIAARGRVDGQLDPVTSGAIHSLGADRGPFAFTSGDVEAGKRLKTALDAFKSSTRTWASGARVMTLSGLGGIGGFVLIGALIATGWLAFANPLHATIWAIVPGLFATFGFEIAGPGAGTRRTPEGRDLWSRIGGFHRILSTPSAEARFDFAGRKDLYTAYLPWAVAFGCADEWAKKYRIEVGEEPPAPSYWGSGYHGVHTGAFVSQMVDSFDATVDSAVSSYEATQRSSSSGGGGGGFGGGGGGGGGGGSW